MRIISKSLEEVIEQIDTTALEKYLNEEFEVENNLYRATFSKYRKQLTACFKMAINNENNKKEDMGESVSFQCNDQKILRWWEVTYPHWQTI